MHRIPLNAPSLVGRELEAITDAVNRGQLSGDGFYTKECHRLIQKTIGSKSALLTHSCTAALEMAAILANVGPGDEVIMPSFTFVSTANAVALRGATPVFVEIDPTTLNISPEHVTDAVCEHTRAILPVHYAGIPADMDALNAIATKHDLVVIEDAAQAYGSFYKGRPCGSLGDLAAFSFHETKNVISGEGGALAINREEFVARAEIIREKGTNRSAFFRGQVDKYTWVDIGSSYLPGELVAAFLFGQLEHEREITAFRRKLFDIYSDAFADLAAEGRVGLPVVPNYAQGNGHLFYLMLSSLEERQAFIAHMASHGVNAPFHYVPLHSSPGGQRFGRTHGQELPITDAVSERLARLPMYYGLGDQVYEVIDIARKFFA